MANTINSYDWHFHPYHQSVYGGECKREGLITNKFFFLIPFLVLAPALAFAAIPENPQVVITQGQNYDLREDYINGMATWTSYQERILEGDSWVDFIVSNDSDFKSVESNSIGS